MTGKRTKLNGTEASYRIPKGAGGRWRMPPEPASNSPMCIANLEFLQHENGGGSRENLTSGLRGDLTREGFAHYLVGEGKGPDGTLPKMFPATDHVPKDFRTKWMLRDKSVDPEQVGFDGKRWPLQQAWCVDVMRRRLPDEPRHYRLMVSPEGEFGTRMDEDSMREFGRELMARVSDDVSHELVWVGSAHFNTDHPHLHFGIRGLDTKGNPVWFHRAYAKKGEGFRRRAREILAEQFGGKGVRRAG